MNTGGVSAARSSVTSEPATITVTARDANDNPIGGATVALSASSPLEPMVEQETPQITARERIAAIDVGSNTILLTVAVVGKLAPSTGAADPPP